MAFRRSWVLSDERWQFETVESVKRFATVCTLLWPLTGMQDSDVTIYVLSKLTKFKKSRAFCVAHFLTPFPIGCQQVRFASPYPQNRELIPISKTKRPVSAPAWKVYITVLGFFRWSAGSIVYTGRVLRENGSRLGLHQLFECVESNPPTGFLRARGKEFIW